MGFILVAVEPSTDPKVVGWMVSISDKHQKLEQLDEDDSQWSQTTYQVSSRLLIT